MPVISAALRVDDDLRARLELALERLLAPSRRCAIAAARPLVGIGPRGSTWVMRPSVAPDRNMTSAGLPSSSTEARPMRRVAAVAVRRIRGAASSASAPTAGTALACAAGAPGRSHPSGVKRSAAFGTSTASWMFVVTISRVAVMPGRSSNSELSTSSTVSYVTTPVEVALLPRPARCCCALDSSGVVRGEMHLGDLRGKRAIRICIDRERRLLADLDRADVGFVDGHVQLHLLQIFGQREQHGRLQRGGDRLSRLDRAHQHDAVDRRANVGLAEIGAAPLPDSLAPARRLHRRCRLSLGVRHRGFGDIHVLLRGQLVAAQLAHLLQPVRSSRALPSAPPIRPNDARFRRGQRALAPATPAL